jgi:hypothetical protein
LLERDILRAARRLPQHLAAIRIQETRIAPRIFLQHLAVAFDRLFGLGILCDGQICWHQRQTQNDQKCWTELHSALSRALIFCASSSLYEASACKIKGRLE